MLNVWLLAASLITHPKQLLILKPKRSKPILKTSNGGLIREIVPTFRLYRSATLLVEAYNLVINSNEH